MKILITNDDGWGFDGIQTLESVARTIGDVWTVAPQQPMSGISHRLTFERPMSFIKKAPQSYALDGTPADCVRVAMTQLDVEFDWVLSGINKGANLGSDMYVSGTVAAAREASLFNCRAIALSQHLRQFNAAFDWSRSSRMATRAPNQLMHENPFAQGWANVNLPDLATGQEDECPLVETEPDRHPLPADYVTTEDGKLLYRSVYNDRKRTPGRDVEQCFEGNLTISYHP